MPGYCVSLSLSHWIISCYTSWPATSLSPVVSHISKRRLQDTTHAFTTLVNRGTVSNILHKTPPATIPAPHRLLLSFDPHNHCLLHCYPQYAVTPL